MFSKNKLKWVRSLNERKYRLKYDKFVAEGEKIVGELVRQHPASIFQLYALPKWLEAKSEWLKPVEGEIISVSEPQLKQLSGLKTPNQVLAVVELPAPPLPDRIDPARFGLYLDGIRDPGNMGTILRIADWFGFDQVICSPDCVDRYHPRVIQSTMGAFLRIAAFTTELSELRERFPNWPFYGMVMDGDSIFESELSAPGLVLIGNEGKGISTASERLLTHRLRIPAAVGSQAESLNAAVATGIVCALIHQRRTK